MSDPWTDFTQFTLFFTAKKLRISARKRPLQNKTHAPLPHGNVRRNQHPNWSHDPAPVVPHHLLDGTHSAPVKGSLRSTLKQQSLIVPWPWQVRTRTPLSRAPSATHFCSQHDQACPTTITREFRVSALLPLSGLLKCCSVMVGGSPPGRPISP